MPRGEFEVQLVDTRYGRRLLVRVGDTRVWLGEREVRELLSVLIDGAFGGGGGLARGRRQKAGQ